MGANELLRLALLTDRDRNIIFNLRPRTRALSQGVGYKGRGEGGGWSSIREEFVEKKRKEGRKRKRKRRKKITKPFNGVKCDSNK